MVTEGDGRWTDYRQSPSRPKRFTRQQIADMPTKERVERIDELTAAMAEGRIDP